MFPNFILKRLKPTRSSTNYTFSTKYARNNKKNTRTSLPSRLKLESRKSKHESKFQLIQPTATSSTQHNFDSLGLLQDVVDGIKKGLKYEHPSEIQSVAISNLLRSKDQNILLGSQTGSGKTLSYLAPMMHFLKNEEIESEKVDVEIVEAISRDGIPYSSMQGLASIRKLYKPRGIIIVPSRQLVEQVTQTAKLLSHYCKLRVVGMHSKTKKASQLLAQPIDILITTPSTLFSSLNSRTLNVSMLRKVVIDEADTLFDSHFEKEFKPLLDLISNQKRGEISFCFVTATFPKTLENIIEKHFSKVSRLTTSTLHSTPKRLLQQFHLIGNSTSKKNLLLDLIKRASTDTNRMIIFCNTVETVDEVFLYLKSRNISAISISSKNTPEEVKHSIKRMANIENDPDFLACVATDMASRGIDSTSVGHVILYDFPLTLIDYLHRVGRTARYGRPGRATSFVTKKDVALAEQIKSSIKKG